MAQVVFVPNVVAWNKAFKLPGGMVDKHIHQIALDTAVEAIIMGPKRTGRLVHGIDAEREGPTSWTVVARGPYSIYVHEGTGIHAGKGPYIILPKKPGGWLHFFSHGKEIFARSVMHPGIKANPYLTDALSRAMRRFTSH